MKSRSTSAGELVLITLLVTGFGWTTNGLAQDEANGTVETVFPIVVDLVSGESPNTRYFDTVFTFYNASTTTETVILNVYTNDGQPPLPEQQVGLQTWDSREFEVAPGTLTYVWAFPGGFNGWGRVTASSTVAVNARGYVRNHDGPYAYVENGLPPWFPPSSDSVLTTYRVVGIRPTGGFFVAALAYCDVSSLSLVNPSQTDTVQVTLEGLDRFGNVRGESSVSIPPMHRVSRFLSEFSGLLGDPPQALTGGTRIAATGPIAVGALLNLAPGNLPIDIPVTPLPMSNSTP